MIVSLGVWALATMLHFALTGRAVRRVLPADATLDERLFAGILGGVASLSGVLHAVAVTSGLGLAAGLTGLALWHAGLAALTAGRRPQGQPMLAQAGLPDLLAIAVVGGVVLTWCVLASASGAINGPDAAHYHVPYAVNVASGASVFALPATPHLYPMAGSVVAAWFIVPVGDPLMVDLAQALPFLLIVASLNRLFGCATGLSGTAWASWLGLALFSTPMFRASSEGSADLWFAAGFVAVVAVVIAAWARREWRGVDLVLLGGALGLLLGSKTTGVPAAVLIGLAATVAAAARRWLGGSWPSATTPSPGVLLAAVVACLGAGGIWLVRNWLQFGSPIAPAGVSVFGVTIFSGEPFQRTTYLSVLGEMDTNAFHLGPRAAYFIGRWFGSWYLLALVPVALLAIDLVARVRDWRRDPRWWPRVALLFVTVTTGSALIWLLIGAPWTGLERSRGLTLRYALPIAALLPLLSLVGGFPLRLRWYERPRARAAALTAMAMGAIALFWTSRGLVVDGQPAPVPGIDWGWLAASGFVVALWRVLVNAYPWRRHAVAATLVTGFALWWAPMVAGRDVNARRAAAAALDAAERAFAAGTRPADAWREPWLALRAAERAQGRVCARRRFYSLTRFDEPLALQPPEFGSEVYYAGRDVEAARRAGPVGPCDYVITTPALEETGKGQAVGRALAGPPGLVPVARTADLIILASGSR